MATGETARQSNLIEATMQDSLILWATNTLNNKGYQILQATPEQVLCTPWSEVSRFVTNQGFVYLKMAPSALSLESNIITVLYKQFHAPVPQIIAINHEEHCFLMVDAGIQLHEFLKHGFRPEILIQVMQDYTAMQIRTTDNVDLFLQLGVPDWRLKQLPKLYRRLIAQEELLIGDGLTHDELKKLEVLESK